ncbi:MAG: hypothetical protein U0547_10410 [Dehalococcoidia bacterium]
MDRYERKASREEADRGALFILKTALPYFPPPGTPFALETRAGVREAAIESEHCLCRGPEKPHEHWWLPLDGLAKGRMVAVLAPDAPGGAYRLRIAEPGPRA